MDILLVFFFFHTESFLGLSLWIIINLILRFWGYPWRSSTSCCILTEAGESRSFSNDLVDCYASLNKVIPFFFFSRFPLSCSFPYVCVVPLLLSTLPTLPFFLFSPFLTVTPAVYPPRSVEFLQSSNEVLKGFFFTFYSIPITALPCLNIFLCFVV